MMAQKGIYLVPTDYPAEFYVDAFAHYSVSRNDLQKILEPPPLLLVHNGRVLWRHLRYKFMSEQDLKTKLREQYRDWQWVES